MHEVKFLAQGGASRRQPVEQVRAERTEERAQKERAFQHYEDSLLPSGRGSRPPKRFRALGGRRGLKEAILPPRTIALRNRSVLVGPPGPVGLLRGRPRSSLAGRTGRNWKFGRFSAYRRTVTEGRRGGMLSVAWRDYRKGADLLTTPKNGKFFGETGDLNNGRPILRIPRAGLIIIMTRWRTTL